jgi:hypothetical protein
MKLILLLFSYILLATLLGVGLASSLNARPISRPSALIFCKMRVPLIQRSVKFDLAVLERSTALKESVAVLDATAAIQLMGLGSACGLLEGGSLSLEEFLGRQSDLLQFAYDFEYLRKLAEYKERRKVTPKGPELSLQNAARELGVTLGVKIIIGQSGNEDLLRETAAALVRKYRPLVKDGVQ